MKASIKHFTESSSKTRLKDVASTKLDLIFLNVLSDFIQAIKWFKSHFFIFFLKTFSNYSTLNAAAVKGIQQ